MGRARANAEAEVEKIEEEVKAEAEVEKIEEEVKAEAEVEKIEEGVEYVIEAPNKAYNGTTATVDFKDGKGVTSNKIVLEYFKARGYKITKK